MPNKKEGKTAVEVKKQKAEINELRKEIRHLEKITKLKDGASKFITSFRQEMKKSIVTAITAAFGFLIALVWRDVIVKVVNSNITRFGLSQETPSMQVYAALIVTLISVVGIMIISKWASK